MTIRPRLHCRVFSGRISCHHWTLFLLVRNIWEIQQEKMVAYTQALQFWVEKADSPTGRLHQLVGSVKELWEEMRCYLSFSDEDLFKGIGLPEETSVPPTKEATPQSAKSISTGTPVEEATAQMAMEPTMEKRPQTSSLVGRRCYIPPDPW